jgi:hypothetical protein
MSALKLALLTTKMVYYVRLLKSGTDFTITFLSSRRKGKTYTKRLIRSQIKELYPEKMLRCLDFRPKSGMSRVPTNIGSSGPNRDFQ